MTVIEIILWAINFLTNHMFFYDKDYLLTCFRTTTVGTSMTVIIIPQIDTKADIRPTDRALSRSPWSAFEDDATESEEHNNT